MRKVINKETGKAYIVAKWFMLTNLWEYYVLDDGNDPKADIQYAFVIGYEKEFGDISMKEVSPYIVAKAEGRKLQEIMPPPGWEWVS